MEITQEVYDSLRKDSLKLEAFYAAGVDNWSGYDEVQPIYREMLIEQGFDVED